jgi:hypothetical protein
MTCNFETKKRNGVIQLCGQEPATTVSIQERHDFTDVGGPRLYTLCERHLQPLLVSRFYVVDPIEED